MKNIGKPCAGKPHARFDEGGLVEAVTEKLFRHRQTKGAETDMLNLTLRDLLSTLPIYAPSFLAGWSHVVRILMKPAGHSDLKPTTVLLQNSYRCIRTHFGGTFDRRIEWVCWAMATPATTTDF